LKMKILNLFKVAKNIKETKRTMFVCRNIIDYSISFIGNDNDKYNDTRNAAHIAA
jgi:translation initiation factor 2B subunit (eIF-2B alpha/beta/delta family)